MTKSLRDHERAEHIVAMGWNAVDRGADSPGSDYRGGVMSAQKRILFLDHVGVLGGAELSLLDIAVYFSEHCHVLTFEDGPFVERLKAAGISHAVLPVPDSVRRVARDGGLAADVRSAAGVVSVVGRLARIARQYDLVYANSQKSFVIGALASKLARRPLIWHLRDLLTGDHFSGGHLKLTIALANRFASSVIANSRATGNAFVERGGDARKVTVIYNGIDTTAFDAVSDEAGEQIRSELGLEGKNVVGVFSRLSPWKGQDVLVEALAEVKDVNALIVGKPLFGEEEDFERELRRQVVELGLGDRVHFLGFRSDIPAIMKAVDIVVHTSKSPEPFGRVVAEGMLSGRPVIATRAGGVIEIIKDHETGLLVEPGDPRAVAGAIRAMFDDPDRTEAMARDGEAYARAHFNSGRMLDELGSHIAR